MNSWYLRVAAVFFLGEHEAKAMTIRATADTRNAILSIRFKSDTKLRKRHETPYCKTGKQGYLLPLDVALIAGFFIAVR